MDITGSRILILGGAGLVGMAINRRMLQYHRPKYLGVTALTEGEVHSALDELAPLGRDTQLRGKWGNVFVRKEFKDLRRAELLAKKENREQLLLDTLGPLGPDIIKNSTLYQIIDEARPDIIIDCINTATALAYQDVFEQSQSIFSSMQTNSYQNRQDDFHMDVENLIGIQYTPQLIRHIQILWQALTDFNVKTYLKIGTTGTGGMGLNIPYTHSEERPSRTLLAKTAMAGAHSMLLFVLGRTASRSNDESNWSHDRNIKAPAPIIKEIKPAAAIAWKSVGMGEVKKKGGPINLYDHSPEKALSFEKSLGEFLEENPWEEVKEDGKNKTLRAPFIDTGENGIFSRGEFEAITDEGQMEFITPEEISFAVESEILGGNSGSDLVAALDSSVLGPTYRAGFLRERAIQMLKELEDTHGVPSIAFENLGPPRLSKLLYEIFLISKEQNILEENNLSPEELSDKLKEAIESSPEIRQGIISIGLAVILPDGKILRGPKPVVPNHREIKNKAEFTESDLDKWAHDGWVDLRVSNMAKWVERLDHLKKEAKEKDEHSGSLFIRNKSYWKKLSQERPLGNIVSWIFLKEEDGERVKR